MQTYPQLDFKHPLIRHTSKASEYVACSLRRPLGHIKEGCLIDHNLINRWLSNAHSTRSSGLSTRTRSSVGDVSLAITRDQQQHLGSFSIRVQECRQSQRYEKIKLDNRSTSSV